LRDRVQRADIVVDQVAIGSYGVFACEAMAAGKPVIAYLSDTVEKLLGEHPIANAAPDSVGSAIEMLLDDRSAAAERGVASAAYVRRVHDGQDTVRLLSQFLR
jgi:glycosyltransferase involved in cell wall biosynthesis